MPLKIYTVTCTRNERIAHAVHELTFTKPEGFTFVPGQFVMFHVPAADGASAPQPRAYSIASTPSEKEILIAIKLKPGGLASTWVEQRLRVGDTVEMKGPIGVFRVRADDRHPLLFVCTGAGIAPFRPMILSVLGQDPLWQIDLVHGVSTEEDLFWHREMGILTEQHRNFRVHHVLSRPRADWTGPRGHVQDVLPSLIGDLPSRSVLVCGNPDMTGELKRLCLNAWNVPKDQFHMEGYV